MCIILHIRDQDNLSSQGEGQKCYIDVDEGKLVANCDEEALTGTSHPYFTQKQSRSPQAGPGQHQK